MGQLAQVIEELKGQAIPGPECGVVRVLSSLEGADRDAVMAQLQTKTGDTGALTASQLTLALRRAGFTLSTNTVQRHRRGVCRCFK